MVVRAPLEPLVGHLEVAAITPVQGLRVPEAWVGLLAQTGAAAAAVERADHMVREHRAGDRSGPQAAAAAVQMAVLLAIVVLETRVGVPVGKIAAAAVRELAEVEQTVEMEAAEPEVEAVPVGIMEEMAASRQQYGLRPATVRQPDPVVVAEAVARQPAAAILLEHPLVMVPVVRAAAQGLAIPPPLPVPKELLLSAILLR